MTAYSDGRAIQIIAPKALAKGDFLYISGWNGIVQEPAVSGGGAVLEVASDRMHWVLVPTDLRAALTMGSVLYADTAGDLTATASTNMPALKVIVPPDTNGYAGVRVLNVDPAAS